MPNFIFKVQKYKSYVFSYSLVYTKRYIVLQVLQIYCIARAAYLIHGPPVLTIPAGSFVPVQLILGAGELCVRQQSAPPPAPAGAAAGAAAKACPIPRIDPRLGLC